MSVFPSTFFGLTIHPGQSYSTTFEQDTHITMASLAATLPKNAGRTSVIIEISGAKFTMCSLTPSKSENQVLDIYINENDEVSFSVVGNCPVDLTGNNIFILPPAGEEEDYDEEIDSDEEVEIGSESGDELEEFTKEELEKLEARLADSDNEDELTEREIAMIKASIAASAGDESEQSSDEEDEDEEEDDEEDDEEMEMDQMLIAELQKRKAVVEPIPVNSKKAKITEIVDEEPMPAVKSESKKAEKKAAVAKEEAKKPAAQKEEAKKAEAKKDEPKSESKVRKLPSGLIIEDSIIGTGPKAKPGKKVSVRYVGKLANGKTFDSNTKGSPFSFKLGKGEVIKGWDLGVQGMNVGGTRKLTIPAALGYGSKGAAPDIPKNAELHFEVKLLAVKQ